MLLIHESSSIVAEDFCCRRLGFKRECAYRTNETEANPCSWDWLEIKFRLPASFFSSGESSKETSLAVAWDVTGKGTTVVRAGAGVVYGVYPLLDVIGSAQGATLNNIPTGFKLVNADGSVRQAGGAPGTQQTGALGLTAAQINWQANANPGIFNRGAGSLACGNGIGNPAPCAINVMDPNFKLTQVITWTLGIQHAFTNNLSLSVAYVGNHGHLSGIVDENAALPGTLTSATAQQQGRTFYNQFPYLGTIQELTDNERSDYNGLQTTLTQRVTHGLFFTIGYTWSHALDMGSDELMGQLLMDSRHPNLDYGNAGFDGRHALNLAWTYTIPGIKTRGQMLEGWQINSHVTFLSAFPWQAVDSTNNVSGTGDLQDRWTLVGTPKDFTPGGAGTLPCFGYSLGATLSKFAKAGCVSTGGSSGLGGLPTACVNAANAEPNGPTGATGLAQLEGIGCYMQGNSVIVPPAQGTFGTMGRDALRAAIPFQNWDFSIFKTWKFNERMSAQFRTEFFNLFNHTEFQNGGQGSGNTSSLGTPSTYGAALAEAGAPSITGNGLPRRIQFGLKLIF